MKSSASTVDTLEEKGIEARAMVLRTLLVVALLGRA